jgi:hypothetical protein
MAKKIEKNPADSMPPFVFPKGLVRFSHLQKPDEFEGKVEYKVEVIVDDSPEWQETLKKLKDFQDDRDAANGRSTKPELTCLKSKDGKKFLKFHSKSQEFFTVVDAKNNPTTEEPWSGSEVLVFGRPEWYKGFGGGLTLYLSKVLIAKNAKDMPRETSGPTNADRPDPFADYGDAGEDPFKGI